MPNYRGLIAGWGVGGGGLNKNHLKMAGHNNRERLDFWKKYKLGGVAIKGRGGRMAYYTD